MENIVLHHTKTASYESPRLSNSFILSGTAVYNQRTHAQITEKIEEEITPIAFYAAEAGDVFKVATKEGHIFRAEKKTNYEWECVGEMEEAILNAFFNQTTGNIVILTESEVILLDKYFNLVKKEEYSEELRELIEKDPLKEEIYAEWSIDGKYIFLLVASVLAIYTYNLEPIADTITVCNKIMNSRLMQTKKYLLNESAYVDSMKRVSVGNDTEVEVEDTLEKNSVVFEKRSKYKLASWHNRFSLIYAVTDQNTIHILERNGLKYKELFHIRECDRKEEKIESNHIVSIRSYNDYMYIINQEGTQFYLKIYYIKNNCLYLKVNQNIAQMGREEGEESLPITAVQDMVLSPQYGVNIVLNAHIVGFLQTTCVNRTARDVIDVDGSRLIMYDLSKCPIPPPMYSREVKIEGVPTDLHAFSSGAVTYKVEAQKYTRVLSDMADTASVGEPENVRIPCLSTEQNPEICEKISAMSIHKMENETEHSTEIPAVLDNTKMSLCGRTVLLTLNRESMSLTIQCNGTIARVEGVTSIAPVTTDQDYLLVSAKVQAWTEIYRVSIASNDADEIAVCQERVARTGKDSRIVFVSEIAVIAIDVYGMLETFYLGFLLENKIDKLVRAGELAKSASLAKKHGLSIVRYLDAISQNLLQNRIDARTLLQIATLLFSEENDKAHHVVSLIEQYAVKKINSMLLQTAEKNYNACSLDADVYAWCSIAVEIYTFKRSPELIVRLAEKFTSKEIISPKHFSTTEKHAIPKRIIEKCIGAISPAVLLQCSLNVYAYTLCYIIMQATDTPTDETNDILLVGSSDRIDPFNSYEETKRRLKIARVAKDKRKQTLYMIKQHILERENTGESLCLSAIQNLKLSIEKECIRDFYLYLLDMDSLCADEVTPDEIESSSFVDTVQSLLLLSGDALVKEGDHAQALNCYAQSGREALEKVCNLQMKLGLWREFFSAPGSQTPQNIQKMEEVLVLQKNILSAAELNLEIGSVSKGLRYLIDIEEYEKVLAYIQGQSEPATCILDSLLQKARAYSHSVQNTTEQYSQNTMRLVSVRERKDREREEIHNGMFADDDCDTTYTRSFITNTFLSSNTSNAKKKKRSSKLRNTVGGRYEEEYVQYVLSELILKTKAQMACMQHIASILKDIQEKCAVSTNYATEAIRGQIQDNTREVESYRNNLRAFYDIMQKTKETDFVSKNTEDDLLYDPDRPIIEDPCTMDIHVYLSAIDH
ncbi:hypothetical protein NEAUS07_1507 [Nematocida ausubeli]|nr:hypothetical protein NEAUS07_1507 [Nematocida ausubeli]